MFIMNVVPVVPNVIIYAYIGIHVGTKRKESDELGVSTSCELRERSRIRQQKQKQLQSTGFAFSFPSFCTKTTMECNDKREPANSVRVTGEAVVSEEKITHIV